jgi:ribosome recycling factor
MSKTIQLLEEQLKGIRRSAISPGFIETLKVPYYGQNQEIGQGCQDFDKEFEKECKAKFI